MPNENKDMIKEEILYHELLYMDFEKMQEEGRIFMRIKNILPWIWRMNKKYDCQSKIKGKKEISDI